MPCPAVITEIHWLEIADQSYRYRGERSLSMAAVAAEPGDIARLVLARRAPLGEQPRAHRHRHMVDRRCTRRDVVACRCYPGLAGDGHSKRLGSADLDCLTSRQQGKPMITMFRIWDHW